MVVHDNGHLWLFFGVFWDLRNFQDFGLERDIVVWISGVLLLILLFGIYHSWLKGKLVSVLNIKFVNIPYFSYVKLGMLINIIFKLYLSTKSDRMMHSFNQMHILIYSFSYTKNDRRIHSFHQMHILILSILQTHLDKKR